MDRHADARDRAARRWMRMNDDIGWGTTRWGRRSNRCRWGRNADHNRRDVIRSRAFRAVRSSY